MDFRHSGLGIASFILAILSGLGLFVVFAIAGVLESSTPGGIPDESPILLVVGLALIAFLFLAMLAIGLGVAGLFQSDRVRLFAVLGVAFAGLSILGTIGLALVGFLMETVR
jgi:hypothetical protein